MFYQVYKYLNSLEAVYYPQFTVRLSGALHQVLLNVFL